MFFLQYSKSPFHEDIRYGINTTFSHINDGKIWDEIGEYSGGVEKI